MSIQPCNLNSLDPYFYAVDLGLTGVRICCFYPFSAFSQDLGHGGNSKGTTCVVDRDVTAYLVVDRVLRFPTEHYGCRYGGYPGFNDDKVIF